MTDRRKKTSALRSSIDADIRWDRIDETNISAEPGGRDLHVVDSWPSAIPIVASEVSAIELYLGSLIDLLVQGNQSKPPDPE